MGATQPLASNRTCQSTAASRARRAQVLYHASIWTPDRRVKLLRAKVAGKQRDCELVACLFGVRSSTTIFAVPILDQRKHDAELLDDTLHLGMRITSMEGGWTQVLDNLSRLPEHSRRLAVRQFGAAALLHDQTCPTQPNPFTDFERPKQTVPAAVILPVSVKTPEEPPLPFKLSLKYVPRPVDSSFSDDSSVISSNSFMNSSSVSVASTSRTSIYDDDPRDSGILDALSVDATSSTPRQNADLALPECSPQAPQCSPPAPERIPSAPECSPKVSESNLKAPECNPRASAAACELEEAKNQLESLKKEVETLSSQQAKLGIVGIRRLCFVRDQIPTAERNLADAQARFNRVNSGSVRVSQRISFFGS